MKIKRMLPSAFLLAAVCLLFCACGTTPIVRSESNIETGKQSENAEIVLNRTEILLEPGDTFRLIPAIVPLQQYTPVYIFLSSDKAVADVDENGLITAIGAGKCTVSVISKGTVIGSACSITVNGDFPDTNTDSGTTGTETTVTPYTEPTVTETTVTEPTVTETTETDTPPTESQTEPTEPTEPTDDPFIPIENIEISCPTLYMGGTYRLTAKVYPENATETFSFYCSDTRYVDLTEDGLLTVKKNDGVRVIIRAQTDETGLEFPIEKALYFPIAVYGTDGKKLAQNDTFDLTVGSPYTVRCVLSPEGQVCTSFTWINESYYGGGINISLDTDGMYCTINPQNAGSAALTAYMKIGGETYTYTIKFNIKEAPAPSISIIGKEITLSAGDTKTLEVTTTNITGELAYLSDDPSVVTVEDGVLIAHTAGTATVTVTNADLTVKDSCTVTVIESQEDEPSQTEAKDEPEGQTEEPENQEIPV